MGWGGGGFGREVPLHFMVIDASLALCAYFGETFREGSEGL